MEQSSSSKISPSTSALLFCMKMLHKVKGTEHETLWRNFREMLESNSLSDVQRKKIEKFIAKAKTKYTKLVEAVEPIANAQKPEKHSVSKASDQILNVNNTQAKATVAPVTIKLPVSRSKNIRMQSPSGRQSTDIGTTSTSSHCSVKQAEIVTVTTPVATATAPTRARSNKIESGKVREKSKESLEPTIATLDQNIKNTSNFSESSLLVEEVLTPAPTPIPAQELKSTKKAVPKLSENPPIKLKLKLKTIFKRHEKRIRKQRNKRLQQVQAERILDQCRQVQISPLKVAEAYSIPVPGEPKPRSRVPKRRESIFKPQSTKNMKRHIKNFASNRYPTIDQSCIKECSVMLTRCDLDIKSPPQKTTVEVEHPVLIPEEPMDTEIQVKEEILSDSPEDHEPIERSISRLSYTIIENELKMTCLLCSFEHHQPAEFKKHLKSNHAKYRWYGNCNACKVSSYSRALKNIAEFDHMLKMHILKEAVEIRKIVTPKPQKASQPKPMVSIPRALLPPEVVKNASPIIAPEKTQKTTPIIANTTKRRLQPWLESTPLKEHKLEDACEKMLNLHCLSALFKCMAVGCSFYTNDMTVFEKHLRLHLLFKPRGEEASYMGCSYCNFRGKNDKDLSQHINEAHGAAKYSCSYCFYRSYGPQVETHQFIYHYEKKPAMIKCLVSHKKDLKKVVEKITQEASRNLSPISCLICNTKHYSFNVFIKHLRAMHNFNSTKCNNCSTTVTMKTIIDHFKTCYKFGNFQCCYCPFATDSRQQYKVHLVKSHPLDLPLYFDRLNEPDKVNPQGLLSIKRIPFIIEEQPCQVTMSPRGDDMRNEENVEVIV